MLVDTDQRFAFSFSARLAFACSCTSIAFWLAHGDDAFAECFQNRNSSSSINLAPRSPSHDTDKPFNGQPKSTPTTDTPSPPVPRSDERFANGVLAFMELAEGKDTIGDEEDHESSDIGSNGYSSSGGLLDVAGAAEEEEEEEESGFHPRYACDAFARHMFQAAVENLKKNDTANGRGSAGEESREDGHGDEGKQQHLEEVGDANEQEEEEEGGDEQGDYDSEFFLDGEGSEDGMGAESDDGLGEMLQGYPVGKTAFLGNVGALQRLLISYHDGKTVPVGPEDRTALHWAAVGVQPKATGVLVEAGLDVNAEDRNRNTPLHCAAKSLAVEVARKLIDEGAALDVKNSVGETPLIVAAQYAGDGPGAASMVSLLLKSGADEGVGTTLLGEFVRAEQVVGKLAPENGIDSEDVAKVAGLLNRARVKRFRYMMVLFHGDGNQR